MTDRTILICACLVVTSILLFAGTGFLLMNKGNPGQDTSGGSFQKNDGQLNGPNHGISSGMNSQPGIMQPIGNDKVGHSAGPSEFRNGECPCYQMNEQSGGGSDHQDLPSKSDCGIQPCPCGGNSGFDNHGHQPDDRFGHCGFGPKSDSGIHPCPCGGEFSA